MSEPFNLFDLNRQLDEMNAAEGRASLRVFREETRMETSEHKWQVAYRTAYTSAQGTVGDREAHAVLETAELDRARRRARTRYAYARNRFREMESKSSRLQSQLKAALELGRLDAGRQP